MQHDIAGNRRRKKLLSALRDSEARERAYLNATSDAAVLLDPQGHILEANENAVNLLGIPMAQLTGACIFNLLPPAKVGQPTSRVADVFRTGQPVRWERNIGDKTVRIHIYPVLQPRGMVSAVAVFAKDLTEQRRIEEQFYHAQRMETLGQFAGNVAHDIRNQLTVVKGYAEMLNRQSLVKPQANDMVAEVLKAAAKSAELAGLLLGFSRKEASRPRRIDMVRTIAEIFESLPGMLGKSIRLSLTEDIDHCWVAVDPNRLQQAVFNLAINSRDAMPQGGELSINTSCVDAGEDFVSGHPGSKPGRYCVLTLSDTGQGMDRATRGRIFEPFFTTKAPGQGTGLGLAMVRTFVRQTHGFIDVESKPAKGTTFQLYFPCDETTGRRPSSRQL